MARYAARTVVPVDQTTREIHRLLTKAGATHYAFGEDPERAMIQFAIHGRHYRFEVRRPTWDQVKAFYSDPRRVTASKAIDDEWMRRWRARLLWVKAQLEFAEVEPDAFEEAMLAHLVLPDGRTMGVWAGPQIEALYEKGGMPPLLGTGGSK